jgi:hypothetical protein
MRLVHSRRRGSQGFGLVVLWLLLPCLSTPVFGCKGEVGAVPDKGSVGTLRQAQAEAQADASTISAEIPQPTPAVQVPLRSPIRFT